MPVSKQFGENLRLLCSRKKSIAQVARDLGINKVQFNRYLNGESYPKPYVLQSICSYFDVNARIMLEPLSEIEARDPALCLATLSHTLRALDPTDLPAGFYLATKNSARFPRTVARELWKIRHHAGRSTISAYSPPDIHRTFWGETAARMRRVDAPLYAIDPGFVSLFPSPGGVSLYFDFWWRPATLPPQVWAGFSAYAAPEDGQSHRAVRFMLEKQPDNIAAILAAARRRGYASAETLLPHEVLALQPGTAFQ